MNESRAIPIENCTHLGKDLEIYLISNGYGNTRDLLLKFDEAEAQRLFLTKTQYDEILKAASYLQLHQKPKIKLPNLLEDFDVIKIKSLDPLVNEVFAGGLRICRGGGSGVIEFSGASGTGKSSLALMWCLAAQHAPQFRTPQVSPSKVFGLGSVNTQGRTGGKAVFISCDQRFPFQRFVNMVDCYNHKIKNCHCQLSLENLFVIDVFDLQNLIFQIEHHLPLLFERHRDIRVVVIDSITANFRSAIEDPEARSSSARLVVLYRIVQKLSLIAQTFGAVVILINQMTTLISNESTESSLVPALGNWWTQLVSTRILFQKHQQTSARSLKVVFSPYLSTDCRLNFRITNMGIEGKYIAYPSM